MNNISDLFAGLNSTIGTYGAYQIALAQSTPQPPPAANVTAQPNITAQPKGGLSSLGTGAIVAGSIAIIAVVWWAKKG